MEKIKNYRIVSTILIVLALVLVLGQADVRRAAADEFKDVRVINPTSQPANVRDVGVPLRTPVQIKVSVFINFGEIIGEANVYTVPAGKRLVIEHVALESETVNTGNAVRGTLSSRFGGQNFIHPFEVRPQAAKGLGGPLFVANHPLLAFADPGQAVRVTAEMNEPEGPSNGFFNALTGTLSGYLEEVLP